MPIQDPLGLPRCRSCGNAFEYDRQPNGRCAQCGGWFDGPRPPVVTSPAYVIDLGEDTTLAAELAEGLNYLKLPYVLTGTNELILDQSAVETLRGQPPDANGGISDDDEGRPCLWAHGTPYPVLMVTP